MKEPAFPCAPIAVSEGLSGLTKREYAAIHIAAAIASRRVNITPDYDAKDAVALADAVLKEAGE